MTSTFSKKTILEEKTVILELGESQPMCLYETIFAISIMEIIYATLQISHDQQCFQKGMGNFKITVKIKLVNKNLINPFNI